MLSVYDVGRNRSFDEALVVQQAATAFLRGGYEGTSIEELVSATGLHRGSLYQAFGSKLGLFRSCLAAALDHRPLEPETTDLVLVATLELAPRDADVRARIRSHLADHTLDATDLGARLLERAGIGLTKGARR